MRFWLGSLTSICYFTHWLSSLCTLNAWLHTHWLFVPLLKSNGFSKDNNNAAQRLLDGVNFMAQSVSELSVKPAKAVTSWLTDQIAPAYWKPNSLILVSARAVGFLHSSALYFSDPGVMTKKSCTIKGNKTTSQYLGLLPNWQQQSCIKKLFSYLFCL